MQQGRLRNPPLLLLGQHLVEAESGEGSEGSEVRRDQRDGDVRGFESNGGEVHRQALAPDWLRKDCRGEVENLNSIPQAGGE